MKRRLFDLLTIILLVVASLFSVRNQEQKVYAREKEVNELLSKQQSVNCWPVDVIVLVDQSQSMFGQSGSDPDNSRIESVKGVMERLANNRLDQCVDVIHRLGMVTFGNTASEILPLVQINMTEKDNFDLWTSNYRTAMDKAGADRSQMATDFGVAFRKAKELFDKAPNIDAGGNYAKRQRAVILITDGNPDYPVGPSGGYETPSQHMCGLTSYLSGSYWSDISIFMLALNAGKPYLDDTTRSCDGKPIRENWKVITQSHHGRLFDDFRYQDGKFIGQFLNLITGILIGVGDGKFVSCGDTFFVDPYASSLDISFSKQLTRNDPDTLIKLEKLDDNNKPVYEVQSHQEKKIIPDAIEGMVLKPERGNSDSNRREYYSFDRPAPGKWRFTIPGLEISKCQERVAGIKVEPKARFNLVEPTLSKSPSATGALRVVPQISTSPYIDPKHPLRFAVQLTTQTTSQLPLVEDKNYHLSIQATVQMPSGKNILPDGASLVPISLNYDKDGLWISKLGTLFAPEKGLYTVVFSGTALHGDKTQGTYSVFTETATFEAKELEVFDFVIINPALGVVDTTCNLIKDSKSVSAMLPISLQLRDKNAKPVQPEVFAINNSLPVFVAKYEGITSRLTQSITLASSPNETGVYKGEFFNTGKMEGCGKGTVTFSFVGSYDTDKFRISGESQTIDINRLESKGVDIEILKPESKNSFVIHGLATEALLLGNQSVNSIALQFRLNDLATKSSFADLTAISTNPMALYSVRLMGPGGRQFEDLPLRVTQRATDVVLETEGGLTITTPGEYYFEILPQAAGFKPGYIPSQSQKVSFQRVDPLFNSVVAAGVLKAISFLVVAFVLAMLFIAIFRSPRGTLIFRDEGTGVIVDSISLRPAWMGVFKARSSALEKIGYSKIVVRRLTGAELKDDDDGEIGKTGRAIKVKLYDTDKSIAYEPIQHSGSESFDIGGGVGMTYK